MKAINRRQRKAWGMKGAVKKRAGVKTAIVSLPFKKDYIYRATGGRLTHKMVPEVKTYDTPYANALTAVSPGTAYVLNGVGTGSTISTRSGNKISLRSVDIDLSLFSSAAAGAAPGLQARIMLFVDKQADFAFPTNFVGTIATDAFLLNTNAPDILVAKRNPTTFDRYAMIYDKVHSVGYFSNVASQSFGIGPIYKKIRIRKNLKNLVAVYNSTATADVITTIQTNSLILWICLSGNSNTNILTHQFVSRLRFTDY